MKWKVLESVDIYKNGFFKLQKDRCELPDGRIMPGYYILNFSDWVQVVPTTSKGELILLRQYRHGAKRTFFEIPGGSTEPGKEEDPLLAAQRELLEETGYEASELIHLGSHFPNPALQNNRLHIYLATGCKKVSSQDLDAFEDIEVELVPWQEGLKTLLSQGGQHALMIASMALAEAHIKKHNLLNV